MWPVSIVIPIWNNIKYLPKLFATLKLKTEVEHEIIVIDQGSTDGSQEFVKDKVNVFIQNKKNTGSTGAWNQGILAAKHPYVMLLNSDTEILKNGWLKLMQGEIGEKVGIVECLETIYDKTTRWAGAAGFLLNKDMVEEIGLFDYKNFWGFCGDTDFWARAHWWGWKFGWCKEILFWHLCGGTHRRGMLKDSQFKDWDEANKLLRTKWHPDTVDKCWGEPRREAENWLKAEKAAGRFK